jgi:hypothetical protein
VPAAQDQHRLEVVGPAAHDINDRNAFQAIMVTLFNIENRLADAISKRTGRSTNDFAVRTAANASMGVLRAALRANVVDPNSPPTSDLIMLGMRRVRACFNALNE